MKYQILKNYGPGYHSRTKAPDGTLRLLCSMHVSLEAAKSACKGRAKTELAWSEGTTAGYWESSEKIP